MSLYWSVNKNMEIIKNITEVSDVYFNVDKWNSYDGYCIETDSRQLYTEQSIKAIIFALLGNISNFLSWDMSKSANQWK